MAQLVSHLLHNREDLSSMPRAHTKELDVVAALVSPTLGGEGRDARVPGAHTRVPGAHWLSGLAHLASSKSQ